MLDGLRSFASSPLGIVVFAIIIAGLLFFGLSGFGNNNIVARVGGQEITDQDFADAYQNMLNRDAQQRERFLTPAQAEAAQLPAIVLNQLVQRASVADQISQLGLSVSDAVVAESLAGLSQFQTSDGVFSASLIENFLRANRMTESELADLQRDQLLQLQIAQSIGTEDLFLPIVYRQIIAEYGQEQRTISYVVLTPDLLGDGELVEPTDEELLAYFEENAENWRALQTRRVVLLRVTPEQLADVSAVTDEEALAAYDARQGDFGSPETRNVWQLIFDSQGEADVVAAALENGQAFDDLVIAGVISPIDLGVVTHGALFDPAVADAAFAMAAGEAQIIEGRSGATLVHVSEIIPGDRLPFAEVDDEIRTEIAEARAGGVIAELYLQIEDERAAGQTLSDVGDLLGLETQTAVFDLSGQDEAGAAIVGLPGGNLLITNAFESDVGVNDAPIRLDGANAYLWFEVSEVIEPRQRPLEEVHDRVVEAWRSEAVELRLLALSESIAAGLRRNEATDDIAAELGVIFQTSEPLTRFSPPPDGTSSASVGGAFGGGLGYVSTVEDATGEGLVVQQVTAVMAPDLGDESVATIDADSTSLSLADALFTSHVFDLQRRLGNISYNESLVRQIIGLVQ